MIDFKTAELNYNPPPSDFIETLDRQTHKAVNEIYSRLKGNVLEALNILGISFDNENDFLEFLKDRCTLFTLPDDRKSIVMDANTSRSVIVYQWIERLDFETKGSTVTATMTCGFP